MPDKKKKKVVNTASIAHWADLIDPPKYLTKDGEYTNTIELYDAIPKFFSREITSTAVAGVSITKKFTHRGVEYEVAITPAPLTDSLGNKYARFPGKSEEVIEDVLRKFAADGQKYVHSELGLGVTFSLYELRNELKKLGKTKSLDEIKESLEIMNMSHITLKCQQEDRKLDIYSAPFPKLILATKEAVDKLGKNIRCSVSFHPLVTRSIQNRSHRLISYDKLATCKSALARRIFKKMSHIFVQAETGLCYSLRMCRMMSDFGLNVSKDITTTYKRMVVPALDELIELNILDSYEAKRTPDDIAIDMYPSKEFAKEIKQANYWQKYISSLPVPEENR